MLGLADFDEILLPIEAIYDKFAESILSDIARRLLKAGKITSTAAWQSQRVIESGKVFGDVVNRISEITGVSKKELYKAFKEAGVRSLKYDNSLLVKAGLSAVNLNLSPAMQRILVLNMKKTASLMQNLTMSTAIRSQTSFLEALDLSYMQVVHGGMDYRTAVKTAVKSVARRGVEVVHYPSGRVDQLDVAMRRAVLTGVAQTATALTWENLVDNDIDLIEVSAHIGARNKGDVPENHALWQGYVYSRKNNPDFPDFLTVTGYGTKTGLSGINCRHSFYPYFEGTPRKYDEETLEAYRNKTVLHRGKEIDFYKATQMQRKQERKIRDAKREANTLQAVGLNNREEYQKVRKLQAQMRRFIAETGLDRKPEREGGKVILLDSK